MKDDTISRAAALKALNELALENFSGRDSFGIYLDTLKDVESKVKALPSATDTNVGGNLIDRQAALNALGERPTVWTDDDDYALGERNQYDMDRLAIETVPSAQLVNIAKLQPNCNQVASDCISRQAAISEIMEDLEDRSLHDDPATPEDYAEGYDEGIRNAAAIVLQMPPAQPGWIPCTPETMPPDYQWYYATCKSLVDNRENWVVEGCYTPWEHFDSTPMIKCGDAEVIAWMPKEFPEPWEGGQDETEQ